MAGTKAKAKRGYWFYKGRGWYVSQGNGGTGRKALLDEHGKHIKDKATPRTVLDAAYGRCLIEKTEAAKVALQHDNTPLATLCEEYLATLKTASTKSARQAYLFDFCTGFPGRFAANGKEPKASDRIHQGLGDRTAATLIKHDVTRFLAAHDDWSAGGGKRTAIQAIKRVLNWAVSEGLISRNPIKGYHVEQPRARVTYFTVEQEEAMLKAAKLHFRQALRVLIRTGARPGCEFAWLQRRHVIEAGGRMTWVFPADETKTRKKIRTILIPDEIAELTRQQMQSHKKPFVFLNSKGNRWTRDNLTAHFVTLKRRLGRKGVKLDADACLYSTRHTFAKRTLGGHWNGKPTSVEILAGLMGNTRDICWQHYAKWCDSYQEPLWAALQ